MTGETTTERRRSNGSSAEDAEPGVAPATRPAQTGPTVTIVIPTRNGLPYLKEAIDSVLAQEYDNIECIVVDAASTDDTLDLLKSYGERLKWVSRPDRGAFDAINDGWKMGSGEILAWVNSDDRLEPSAVALAARYFRNHPEVDVFYGACGGIDEHGAMVADFPARPWDLHLALQNCDHIIHQTASFVRRSIVEKVGYLYPAWCHDHDLWLRIAVAGGVFANTSRRLGSARIWANNMGNNPSIIVPAKVGLTRRIFDNPQLPESLRGMRAKALSSAYLRCLYFVSPTKPKNWFLGASLFFRAILANPPNVFYLTGQVLYVLLGSTPIGGLASKTRRGLEALLSRLPTPRKVWAIFRRIGPPAIRFARAISPVVALAVAAGVALGADLSTFETAEVFLIISVPLLIVVYIYDMRSG